MTHYIFDCDDVLLDWLGGFLNYVRKSGLNPDPSGPDTWDMSKWLNLPPSETCDLVALFNDSSEFSNLDAIDGAYKTLTGLLARGHTASVLTACGCYLDIQEARLTNLSKMFGDVFKSVDFLPLGHSKFETLYNMSRRSSDLAFVEDNFRHAMSGVANGIKSYCVRKKHNRHDETEDSSPVIWIDDIRGLL